VLCRDNWRWIKASSPFLYLLACFCRVVFCGFPTQVYLVTDLPPDFYMTIRVPKSRNHLQIHSASNHHQTIRLFGSQNHVNNAPLANNLN
jgi:hypothetical protein